MVPRFKEKKYYDGLNAAVGQIAKAVKGEYVADTKAKSSKNSTALFWGLMILWAIVMLIAAGFSLAHRGLGGVIGAVFAPIALNVCYGPSLPFLVLTGVIGFILGLFSKEIVEVGVSLGSSSSGGDSSGSSSSGFFGNGGSSGGGGASSGW